MTRYRFGRSPLWSPVVTTGKSNDTDLRGLAWRIGRYGARS